MESTQNVLRALRGALISLALALASAGAVSTSAHAQNGIGPGDVGPQLGTTELVVPFLVVTATSGAASTRAGYRGLIGNCFRGMTGNRVTATCTDTSTAIAAMGYPSRLRVFLQDGDNNGALSITNLTLTIVCDDVMGNPMRHVYASATYNETPVTLGNDTNGRIAYCTRVRSVQLTNSTGAANISFAANDYFSVTPTAEVVIPWGPFRGVGALGGNGGVGGSTVEKVCMHFANNDLMNFCSKGPSCAAVTVPAGGVSLDVSSCWSSVAGGDQEVLTAANLHGSNVVIRARRGVF